MEREVIAKKRWSDATIRDNFVFSKTMEMIPTCVASYLSSSSISKFVELTIPNERKRLKRALTARIFVSTFMLKMIRNVRLM